MTPTDRAARIAEITRRHEKTTPEQIYRAAIKWCGEKERETFPEDIQYFEENWSALPGLKAYVQAERFADVVAELAASEARAREARKLALEEAAEKVDRLVELSSSATRRSLFRDAAYAIRKLAEERT